MRTKKFLKHLFLGALLLTTGKVVGQVSTGSNVAAFGTDFLGWNTNPANSLIPLQVRHNLNQPIEWYTNGLQRMKLFPNVSPVINGYGGLPRNGSLVLSNLDAGFAPARVPFSRLHLIDVGGNTTDNFIAAQVGFRYWMRNGVTFTGNSDQSYIGAKYGVNEFGAQLADVTDMVLQWSNDVPGENGPDRLRFLYTADRVGGSTHGSNSEEGLEAMRFTPIDNATINAGLGDFYRGNILDPVNVNEPTERLDILNGRLRIRDLPLPAGENTGVSKYMVVADDGVVHWRNLPPAATPGCEWFRYGPSSNYVLSGTAAPSGGSCPDRAWLYGIGTVTPSGKFTVVHNASERATDAGIRVNYTAASGTGSVFGMQSTIGGAASSATVANGTGLLAELYRPTQSGTGVLGRVTANESTAAMSSFAGVSGVSGVVSITAGSAAWSFGAKGEVIVDGGSGSQVHGGFFKSTIQNPSVTVPNSKGLYAQSVASGGTVTDSYGLHAIASNTGSSTVSTSYGVYAESSSTGTLSTSHGLKARGVSGTALNYGVFALAQGNTNNATNYGLYAQVINGTSGTHYAGYFQGNMHVAGLASCTNSVWSSDESIKTDIEDLSGARELLAQIRPRSCRFRVDELPYSGLPEGVQHGVIAQEIQEVMPELVQDVHLASVMDEDGVEVQAARSIKAVNYIGLIPVLISAAQDQQRQLDEQDALLDELRDLVADQHAALELAQSQLAACCANPDGSRMLDQGLNQPNDLDGSLNGSEKLRIQPNPFNERTTVFYTLDRGGRTQLLANSSDGRDLRVLQEANLEAGDYQHEWHTADLATGVYYVTLLLDGEPIVKKAVKVDR